MSGPTDHPVSSPVRLFRNLHAVFLVSDLQRSIQFYREKLGIALAYESPEVAVFELGDGRLSLQAREGTEALEPRQAGGEVGIGFGVDDVVETYEVLRTVGVHFPETPCEREFGPFAILSDPDGYPIMLFESRKAWTVRAATE